MLVPPHDDEAIGTTNCVFDIILIFEELWSVFSDLNDAILHMYYIGVYFYYFYGYAMCLTSSTDFVDDITVSMPL